MIEGLLGVDELLGCVMFFIRLETFSASISSSIYFPCLFVSFLEICEAHTSVFDCVPQVPRAFYFSSFSFLADPQTESFQFTYPEVH